MPKGVGTAIKLLPVQALDTAAQMKLRDIRNEDSVRFAMFTDHFISVDEHLRWIGRLNGDSGGMVWAIVDGQVGVLGQVSVQRLDRRHKTGEFGIYVAKEARGGLGFAAGWACLNFVFDRLGIEKLTCEVIEGNAASVNFHRKLLFRDEGFRRFQVIKGDARVGVHLLGLTRQEWIEGRDALARDNRDVREKFPMTVEWTGEESLGMTDERMQ